MSPRIPRTAAVALALAVAGATLSLTSPAARAAGLLIADGGMGGVLEIKEHDVKVVINNGVAVTHVEQVFVNTENRIVEALYTFPVPKGASVANFSMWINGKEMIGEVVEKKRARQIYESYKTQRRDPGLLEQVDYKRFEMRIFPIAAGAEQRVRISYYQELDFDHDWATYVYPLATLSRRDVDERTTGKMAFTLDVKSEVPIVEMESPSHADGMVLVGHSDRYRQASLETDAGSLARDVVIAYKTERPHTGLDVITSKQSSEDGYFMLTLTAGKELSELNDGMDYVFVLDVSGSMAHDGKLRLSRDSIGAFIKALGPEDRFDVVTFNVAAKARFNQLTTVNDETLSEAAAFLESQQARGGTFLRPALQTAYQYHDPDRTLNVVILSDGMTEQGEQRELLQLITQRPSGTRVFSIGVGNEVNRPLLNQLARDAGGLAAFLSVGDRFERQAQAFRRKLMHPALADVRLSFDGAGVYDVEPEQLSNLYHGAPIRVYGRYRKASEVTVKIEGDVLGAPLTQEVAVSFPKADDGNPEIERMWAWHRVDRLLASQRESGSKGSHRDEIVRLCEGYSITSPFASFIVLENDGEYRRWKIERRNVTRVARDRAAQKKVRRELNRLRERATASAGPLKNAERAAKPLASARRASGRPDPQPVLTVPNRSPRSRDISIRQPSGGSSGGGGAIDPVSGTIALGLAGASLIAARRRRRRASGE